MSSKQQLEKIRDLNAEKLNNGASHYAGITLGFDIAMNLILPRLEVAETYIDEQECENELFKTECCGISNIRHPIECSRCNTLKKLSEPWEVEGE